MELIVPFALALGLTLIVELPLAALLRFKREDLLIVLLVNLVTNPCAMLLYYGLRMLLSWNPLRIQLPIECAAVLSEALVYRIGTARQHPVLLSLLLNGASYLAGLLVNQLL